MVVMGPVGIDDSFDSMVLHGLHGMTGTPDDVLSHSFYPMPRKIWFNDNLIGEIAMDIYTFREYKISCIMVTGDSAAVEETRKLVHNIEGVTVKWG